MSDITITIDPPNTNSITVNQGLAAHNTTHAPGGSDSLATWYALAADLTGISGQISFPNNVVFTTGDQNISGEKNFYSRPTINGTGVLLSGEASAPNTGYLTGYVSKTETGGFVSSSQTGSFLTSGQTGALTGSFYPLNSNPSGYVVGAVVRPSNTGGFVDTNSEQIISGKKTIYNAIIGSGHVIGSSSSSSITILGGGNNYGNGQYSTILGGGANSGNGSRSLVVGGVFNRAIGNFTTVINGEDNSGISNFATVLGGRRNLAGRNSVTIGGEDNFATGTGIYILGTTNTGFGSGSYILGRDNIASGNSTVIIGRNNTVTNDNAMVISLLYPTSSSGEQTLVVRFDSGIYLNGPVILNNRPTLNGTGFLLSGEAAGGFDTGVLTGYVNKSETGVFYAASNPASYITAAALSPYATTTFVTGISGYQSGLISSIQAGTGTFITSSQTGAFYPINNPSGFITNSSLTPYATTGYVTGVSGYLEGLISASSAGVGSLNGLSGILTIAGAGNNSVSIAGSTITVSGNTGFITGYQAVGNYVTTAQTGQFYPVTNPSGFITGVDLSTYATTSLVNGVSGHLQGQITTLQSATGNLNTRLIAVETVTGSFVTGAVVRQSETGSFLVAADLSPYATTIFVTGISGYQSGLINGLNTRLTTTEGQIASINNGTGNFVSSSQTGAFYPITNPSGYITGVDLSTYATITLVTNTSGYQGGLISSLQTATGTLNTRLTAVEGVTGSFVTGSVVRPSETGVFLTSSSLTPYATTAFVTGVSGYHSGLISTLQSSTGAINTRLASVEGVTGSFALSSNTGAFLTTGAADSRYTLQSATGAYTGAFYPLLSNPSNYLVTADLSTYATQSYVTGASGHLQGQITILNSQTGQFYPTSNPSGYITGVVTGTFLTTGNLTGIPSPFTISGGNGTANAIYNGASNFGLYAGGFHVRAFNTNVLFANSARFEIHADAPIAFATLAHGVNGGDTFIKRGTTANTVQLGQNHATTPTHQTFRAHHVTAGTGANLTLAAGSGSLASGNIVLHGANRIPFVSDATTGDLQSIVDLLNAVKSGQISHGLMKPF